MNRMATSLATARKKLRGVRKPFVERMRRRELERGDVVLSTMPAKVTLEMTARCNLVCVTCRRYHVHEERSTVRALKGEKAVTDIVGSSGYMEPRIFERALDLVRDAHEIELTGYGEPMLNPDFHDYARQLKQRGHRLHTITNGTILNEANIAKLIENRFDMISVSVDGVSEDALSAVRGVDKKVLFDNLERMRAMKEAAGLGPMDAPKLGVAFVMARFNIREMPEVVRALIPLGLNHFYAQNLEACTSPEVLGPHLLYTDPDVREEAQRIVDETEALCRDNDVRVDITPIPTCGREGWEPEGVAIDDALAVLRGTSALRIPPKRRYEALKEVQQRQDDAFVDTVDADADAIDRSERAAITELPARLVRENARCLDFFRYAFVAWNGKVLSCCLERYAVGDLNRQRADAIWNGPLYRRLRRAYHERGIRSVCEGCSRIMD